MRDAGQLPAVQTKPDQCNMSYVCRRQLPRADGHPFLNALQGGPGISGVCMIVRARPSVDARFRASVSIDSP
jgi:hypothetical protein